MIFTRGLVALVAASTALAAPWQQGSWGPTGGISWGRDKVKGVNIGGWLVLEPWITPSIFQKYPIEQGIVDEYTLNEKLGSDNALNNVLKPHWDSWVSLADFQKISKSGFNLVRIPVGFWAYDTFGTPYSQGAAPYIDKAIDWARQTNLKVVIDLHGAPRSQNGFDNSGQKLAQPGWQSGDSVAQTLQVLETIQSKYGNGQYDDVVAAIEVLNEPLNSELNLDTTKQFTKDAFNQQRQSSQSRVVMFQDGFEYVNSYNGFLSPSDNGAQWVVVDHHEYQCFTNDLVALKPYEHRQAVCNNAQSYSGGDKWTIVGEWSGAMTDCAAALNGYGIGARYDGTYPGSKYVGSCATVNFIDQWTQTFKDDVRGYIEAQMESYEYHTNGWVFWNFKTEGSPEWDAFRLIDAGIFPQPLTDRKFGQICTNW